MSDLLKIQNVSKAFPGVKALQGVDLNIEEGEIHALVGQNGAGKSTLVKLIAGLYKCDSGRISFCNQDITDFPATELSKLNAVAFIHQELNLIESFSSRENVFLGNELEALTIVKKQKERAETERLFEMLGTDVLSEESVSNLTSAQKQLVVIARALLKSPKLLVLDEPTARLSAREVDDLFNILRDLSSRGVSMLYISHRLEEIFSICNRVSVLRNGNMVGTYHVSDLNRKSLVKAMLGQEIGAEFPDRSSPEEIEAETEEKHAGVATSRYVLRVKGIASEPRVRDVSFSVRPGEIVALVGAVGSGKTETIQTILGERKRTAGSIELRGKLLSPRHPAQLFAEKVGYCPENRKSEGLVLEETIRKNISLPSLHKMKRTLGVLSRRKEEVLAQHMVGRLRVTCYSSKQVAGTLSGGNQQKVVLAKWLQNDLRLLILDEPTIGIDVGSRIEVYNILRSTASAGAGILIATSDVHEALGISDRLIVVYSGRTIAELKTSDTSREEALYYVMGGVDVD